MFALLSLQSPVVEEYPAGAVVLHKEAVVEEPTPSASAST